MKTPITHLKLKSATRPLPPQDNMGGHPTAPANSPQTSMDRQQCPSTPSLEKRICRLNQRMDGATSRLEAATKQLGNAAKALEAAANLQLQASKRPELPGPSQLLSLQVAVEELQHNNLGCQGGKEHIRQFLLG